MTDLTKSSQKLLCLLYKEFLERKRHSVSHTSSIQFLDYVSIQENFLPDETSDDVIRMIRELHRAGYIEVIYGNGRPEKVFLLDKTIIAMENKFKDDISALVDFILKLSSLL